MESAGISIAQWKFTHRHTHTLYNTNRELYDKLRPLNSIYSQYRFNIRVYARSRICCGVWGFTGVVVWWFYIDLRGHTQWCVCECVAGTCLYAIGEVLYSTHTHTASVKRLTRTWCYSCENADRRIKWVGARVVLGVLGCPDGDALLCWKLLIKKLTANEGGAVPSTKNTLDAIGILFWLLDESRSSVAPSFNIHLYTYIVWTTTAKEIDICAIERNPILALRVWPFDETACSACWLSDYLCFFFDNSELYNATQPKRTTHIGNPLAKDIPPLCQTRQSRRPGASQFHRIWVGRRVPYILLNMQTATAPSCHWL